MTSTLEQKVAKLQALAKNNHNEHEAQAALNKIAHLLGRPEPVASPKQPVSPEPKPSISPVQTGWVHRERKLIVRTASTKTAEILRLITISTNGDKAAIPSASHLLCVLNPKHGAKKAKGWGPYYN